jgi:hypothetical protein
VQSALLKLYIELENDATKIQEFFSQYGDDGQSRGDGHIYVKAQEIDKYNNNKNLTARNNQANIVAALLYEQEHNF